MRSFFAFVLFASSVALVGCGSHEDPEASSGLRHEVDSTGAIVRVRSAGDPPLWNLAPVLAVGSDAGVGEPAPDEFGHITSVATDAAGNLWVADAFSHDIRVFDAEGALVRRIGRQGQGPGEFVSPYSLAWVGDVLLVLDFGAGRIAELSATGEWLGTRPAPGRISGSPAMLRFYPVSDSVAVQWSLGLNDPEAPQVWIEHGAERVAGEWRQPSMEAPVPTTVRCDAGEAISFFGLPFGGQMVQHPAATGLTWVGWSRDYRIALINAEGDTVRVLERDRPAVPITDAEWNEARADYAEFRETWPGARCEPRGIERPDHKPAYRNFLVDTSGWLWVEAYTESGLTWELFDREGRLRGALPGFEYSDRVAPSLRGNLVAWVEADSMGVQRVRMARLQGAPAR
jgi:hypothetical protein